MRPSYYRYCYSSTTGDVDLSHNEECHPAKVPTHGSMAEHRPENDLQLGYAYRIHGGWRVTDADHRPVNDPHILHSVVQAIAHADNFGSQGNPKPPGGQSIASSWGFASEGGNGLEDRTAFSQGGPTIMPCPVCGRDGCTEHSISQSKDDGQPTLG